MTLAELDYKAFIRRYHRKSESDVVIYDNRCGTIQVKKDGSAVSIFFANKEGSNNIRELEFIKDVLEFVKSANRQGRFIVPLPCLKTTDGEKQYLTYKDGTYFACRRNVDLQQTFAKKELDDIPEEYKKYAIAYIRNFEEEEDEYWGESING